jgi:GNAT superfamily N-acetyltransferase
MFLVRPYAAEDRLFIFSLAPRLAAGMRPWRDLELWLASVDSWLAKSIDGHNQDAFVFIAEDESGERLGFATVTRSTHFTGQPQAYLGELVTLESAEGGGVGTALVEACEQWAREQGYRLLALTTGAANTRALSLYHKLGFQDEDVSLTKLL